MNVEARIAHVRSGIQEWQRRRGVDQAILEIVREPVRGSSVSREPMYPLVLFPTQGYPNRSHDQWWREGFDMRIDWPGRVKRLGTTFDRFDAVWQNQQKVRAKTEILSPDNPNDLRRLQEIADGITQEQKDFLFPIAQKYAGEGKTLADFFLDPRISPDIRVPGSGINLHQYDDQEVWKFTISGLAPKAENPQKSQQFMPDAAELALMLHYKTLSETAERFFNKRVEFTFLTEGHYVQHMLGFNPEHVRRFDNGLHYLLDKVVRTDRITLADWYDGIAKYEDYKPTFELAREKLVKKWEMFKSSYPGDPRDFLSSHDPRHAFNWIDAGEAYEKLSRFEVVFEEAIPTVYQTIKPPEASHRQLRRVYTAKQSPVTHQHIKNTMEAVINLMAFNIARKQIGAHEREYPGYIYGTFTPGPGKKGFYWNRFFSGRYPNHGVGIIYDELGVIREVETKREANIRRPLPGVKPNATRIVLDPAFGEEGVHAA